MGIIAELSSILAISREDIIEFASSAPYRYKVYMIPKRKSGEKREIAHPSKELKFIQRILCNILESKLPVHERAFAYRKDVSIRDNANQHLYNPYLLKIDLKNFFPSITPELFLKELNYHGLDIVLEDFSILSNIFFRRKYRKSTLTLSIGAPSSPMISNFIMYSFDKIIHDKCNSLGIVYTRYADDMTFSTAKKNVLFSVPELVQNLLLERYSNNLSINGDKTVFSSRAHNRHVTGITLSNNNVLSIGRGKKRNILAGIHHFIYGKLDDEDIARLRGKIAFSIFIEPKFRDQIERKYGKEKLLELFQYKF